MSRIPLVLLITVLLSGCGAVSNGAPTAMPPVATEEPAVVTVSSTPAAAPTEDAATATAEPRVEVTETLASSPTPLTVADATPAPASCTHWTSPALLAYDEANGEYVVLDPLAGAPCRVPSQFRYPEEVAAMAGKIYFGAYGCGPDAALFCISIGELSSGRLAPAGELVAFTSGAEDGEHLQSFAVGGGGAQIAWSTGRLVASEGAATRVVNTLWVANGDGARARVVAQEEIDWPGPSAPPYYRPLRFSADGSVLYYTLQPQGLGGGTFAAFVGRYHNLYAVAADAGAPQLLFDCAARQNLIQLCIGDFYLGDAGTGMLAYVEPGDMSVRLVDFQGQAVASFSGPQGTQYVGYPLFNGSGGLAFYAATFDGSEPAIGHAEIRFVAPPYSGQAETVVEGDAVFLPHGWLDDAHLIYRDASGEGGLAMVVWNEDGSHSPAPIAPPGLSFMAILGER